MRYLIALLLICSISKDYGQDSLPGKLKPGLYKHSEEFAENNPSVLLSFNVLPVYRVNTKNDTTVKGFTYEFSDSVKKQKNIFGFCDGKNRYVAIEEFLYESNLIRDIFHKTVFHKIDPLGKYPFMLINQKEVAGVLYNGNPFVLAGTLLSTALIPANEEVWYFNKKGEFRKATNQSIAWLLRADKDFLEELNKDKATGLKLYIKYLKLMNERYNYE